VPDPEPSRGVQTWISHQLRGTNVSLLFVGVDHHLFERSGIDPDGAPT
jgi:hypothetical protein